MSNFQVDRDRWSRFTIFEQMGNIGSEVGRIFKAGTQNDTEAVKQGVNRTLDLFEATTDSLINQKSQSGRLKEVLRAKDQFLQIVINQAFNSKEARDIDRYFLNFALAARSQK